MKTDDVYQFFGSARNASKAIGVTRSAFYKWMDRGYIPLKQQKIFELLTKGKLLADIKKEEKEFGIYLPSFRYYDKKYGICCVKSIHFRKGKSPKITYSTNGKKVENLSVFTTKNLMQGVDVVDCEGEVLYEGDICLIKNKEKFIFENIEMLTKLKKLGKFKIIGNIFE